MKSLSIFAFLLVTTVIFSQDKLFQLEVGLNKSWYNYKYDFPNDVKTQFNPQFTFGVNYNLISLYNFSFKPGIRYSNLSRAVDMKDYGYGSSATFDNYLISVPLQLNYNIEVINSIVFLNVEPAYIIKSKIKSPSTIYEHQFETREVTSEMNRFQFSIGAGLEYVFSVLQENFSIKSFYNIGLTKVPKEGEFRNATSTYEWLEFKTTSVNLFLTYYF